MTTINITASSGTIFTPTDGDVYILDTGAQGHFTFNGDASFEVQLNDAGPYGQGVSGNSLVTLNFADATDPTVTIMDNVDASAVRLSDNSGNLTVNAGANTTLTDTVDGEDFAEEMAPGYNDAGQTTNGGGDLIDGADGNDDIIEGNGGNDTITAGEGADLIDGGTGNDIIYGDNGDSASAGGQGVPGSTLGDGPGSTGGSYERVPAQVEYGTLDFKTDAIYLGNDIPLLARSGYDGPAGGGGDFRAIDGVSFSQDGNGTDRSFGLEELSLTGGSRSYVGIIDIGRSDAHGENTSVSSSLTGGPQDLVMVNDGTVNFTMNDGEEFPLIEMTFIRDEDGNTYMVPRDGAHTDAFNSFRNLLAENDSGIKSFEINHISDVNDSIIVMGGDWADGQFYETVDGDGGDDTITGGEGADQMFGEGGDDTFTVGSAAEGAGDVISGGNGPDENADNDVLDLRGAGDVTIDAKADENDAGAQKGTVTFEDGSTLKFEGIETILQGSGPDGVVDGEDYAEEMGPDYNDAGQATDGGGDIIDGADGDNDVIEGNGGDDTITAGAGDDTIDGGADDDLIYGDNNEDLSTDGTFNGPRESLNWDLVSDPQADTSFVQDTGDVKVTYTRITDTGSHESEIDNYTPLNTDGIDSDSETIDTDSSLKSTTSGDGDEGAFQFKFDEPVGNLEFNVNDLDGDGVVTITAYGPDGVTPISVELVGGSDVEVNGNTATAVGGYQDVNDPDINVQVTIPGPVSKIVVEHEQVGSHNSGIHITDMYFDTGYVPGLDGTNGEGGDDVITGGEGADTIFGEGGDDTFVVGSAADGAGDVISGGNGPDENADNDVLDLRGAGLVTIDAQVDEDDAGAQTGTVTFEDGSTLTFDGIETILTDPQEVTPLAVDDVASTDEDTSVTIDVLFNDTDPNGDMLAVVDATVPTDQGTVEVVGNKVVFTPAPNFNGDAKITYTIQDPAGNQDTGEVAVTVNPVNDAPDAADDSAETDFETPVTIDVLDNDTDIEKDPLTITEASVPAAQGEVDIVGGKLVFTPADGFEGDATISYTVSDGDLTDTAEVVVTVGEDPADGVVDGAEDGEVMDPGYTDPQGDEIDGDDGLDDIIKGNGGDDDIDAGLGDDDVSGGTGNDTIDGNDGEDTIDGGEGDDEITGGDGSDSVLGGDGDDVIDTSGPTNIYTGVGLPDSGYPDVFPGDADPENDKDTVDGGDGNDVIKTGDDADVITGGTGSDTIDGGIDNDTIDGGDDNDRIVGGEGADDILGGSGNDTIYAGNDPELGLDIYNIEDDGTNPLGDDLNEDNGKDTVSGGGGNDLIFGADDDDLLMGDEGNDTIDGGIDDDTITGGTGNDSLLGGQGNDSIEGGVGDDLIDGGIGDDTLLGGDDRDTFVNVNAGDTIDGGEGGDDFDTLDLHGSLPAGGSFKIVSDPANDENGVVNYFDSDGNAAGTLEFTNIERVIPCFTPGTLIATSKGERLVEELQPGDRIITRDNGFQEIAWVGAKQMSGRDFAQRPNLKPVFVKAGSLGAGFPERDMMLSPNHKVLFASDQAELYFAEREVLVAAKHLIGKPGIRQVDVTQTTYIHFMFERHEVVLSNGSWTESFHPGDYSINGIDENARDEIISLFPELATDEGLNNYRLARTELKKHEARLLVS